MPASGIRSAEEVMRIRQARQQAQQQAAMEQQQAALAQGVLAGYDKLATAPQQGSPVAALMGGGQVAALPPGGQGGPAQ
jgi:hypothetical protein